MNRYWSGLAMLALCIAGQQVAAGIGDIDPSYGTGGKVDGLTLPLADGRALRWANQEDASYSRLDSQGRMDPAFGAAGLAPWPSGFRPYPKAWLRLPDGSTLLGGTFNQSSSAVVRLQASGAVDTSLAGTGVLAWPQRLGRSQVEDLLQLPDGRILVLTGEYHRAVYEEGPVQVLVRGLTSSLATDAAFGSQGEVLVADFRTSTADYPYLEASGPLELAVMPNGGIVYLDGWPAELVGYPLVDQMRVRIRYLDASGRSTQPPTVNAALDPSIRDWRVVADLPDCGLLVRGHTASAPRPHHRLYCLLPDGSPNPRFGTDGSFLLDGTDVGFASVHVSPDGRYLYLSTDLQKEPSDIGQNAFVHVLRVHLQGVDAGKLDTGFGRQGVAELRAALGVLAMQAGPDHSLLIGTERGTYRLLAVPNASPGLISLSAGFIPAGSSAAAGTYLPVGTNVPAGSVGQIVVRVTRSAGSSGSVSMDYRTDDPGFLSSSVGRAGIDYMQAAGRLDWADGDSADKFVAIWILPGVLTSNGWVSMYVDLQLEAPAGGAATGISRANLHYSARISQAPTNPTGSGGSGNGGGGGGGGGGGAVDLRSLLALALLALGRAVAAAGHGRNGYR